MLAKQILLREVQVRPGEVPRWTALMRRHHYLGFRKMCGHRLHHVAVWRGRWLALLGWHAAALHCTARDCWIGWSSLQRRARLFLVSNNTRFLVLPAASGQPCLASRVLGRSLRRLPHDWQQLHGHSLLLAETFVDPALFAGTCYRAANWIEVGATPGGSCAPRGRGPNGNPGGPACNSAMPSSPPSTRPCKPCPTAAAGAGCATPCRPC